MKILLRVLSFTVLIAARPTFLIAQDYARFWESQMTGLRTALSDPTKSARVYSIWTQLVNYSGRMYTVRPSQQFTLGQALPNGVVLLDLSVAGDPDVAVTAFWLAHEYGHQVMGHPSLLVTQWGRYVAASSGTYHEDSADRWAARFLRRQGYPLAPVIDFLCMLPGGGYGDSHSGGPTRALNVAETYGFDTEDPCSDGIEEDIETYEPRLQIWSRRQGNPATMDVYIDDEYVGSLSNLDEAETLELGELSEGMHTFTLSDITLYGPYGVMASGLWCSGTIRIQSDRRLRLWTNVSQDGTVRCGFQ